MTSPQRHLSAEFYGANVSHSRPTSVQLEQLQARHSMNQQRPLSEQIPANANYKSTEAQAIDKWFEDLSYYERTIEEMSITTLDDSFKDELAAIENWFRVLSDPERTACLYSLLKGTTPLQIKFFITVLTQMAAKDANIDPLSHSVLRSPSGVSVVSNTTEDLSRLFSRPNSQRLSAEHNIRSNTLLRSSSQDDLSDDAVSNGGRQNVHSSSASVKNSLNSSSRNSIPGSNMYSGEAYSSTPQSKRSLNNKSASLEPLKSILKPATKGQQSLPPRPPYEKHSPTTNSGSQQPHAQQTASAAAIPIITPRQLGGSLPRPRQNAATENDEWDSTGTTLSRPPRDRPSNDSINLNEIQDIPTWFRSLRLHKYTTIFENDDWRSIIRMTENQLIDRGVAALGARRKMLKVFEAVRAELDAKVFMCMAH